MSRDDIPEIGEVVIVRTRHHAGEPGRVTRIERPQKLRYASSRVYVYLESVDGSLYGAQGWYQPHEFDRRAPALTRERGE